MVKKVANNSKIQIVTLLLAAFAFGMAGVALLRSSSAAPTIPTGTISVKSGSDLRYGGSVSFDTTVSSYRKGDISQRVICLAEGKVVYQASNGGSYSNGVFPLIDQAGDNLDWQGQAATCTGELIYSVDGKKPTIVTITQTMFNVAAN